MISKRLAQEGYKIVERKVNGWTTFIKIQFTKYGDYNNKEVKLQLTRSEYEAALKYQREAEGND